ncbi:GtrA family protein [Parenemella sanctibonifatiensis]|uniref:GtrA family protein n=1 Tax=Parenemella sanctibonifatiensis TaxID=2016505 RepID=UPI001E3D30E4|nr:GtrA family protein [Parenemella sanctibonifatiensis]
MQDDPDATQAAAPQGWRRLFTGHTDHVGIQLFRYVFVGGTAAVVDLGLLLLLSSVAGRDLYLVWAGIAFLAGLAVNYLLSIAWVFQSSDRRRTEMILFAAIGVVGLGFNELILWIGVSQLGQDLTLSKLVSMVLVMFWNFFARRTLFARLNQASAGPR